MNLPTASSLQRAFICDASNVLPRVKKAGSGDARRGTAIHKFLEDCGKGGRDAALSKVPDEFRDHAEAIDLDRMMVGDGIAFASEMALAWDYETGQARELGRGLTREEAYRPAQLTEFVGTLDLLGLTEDAVVIPDIKTGWGWTPAAKDNWQLRFAAVAACALFGKSRARVAIVKLHEDGSPWFDWHDIEPLDLAVYAEQLRGLATRIELLRASKVTPTATESEACRYCESYVHCPAKTKLAAHLASGLATPDVKLALTPATAALAWDRVKAARMVLDEVEAKVKEFALENPLMLPGGAVLGPVETSRDEFDGEKAFAALTKLYNEHVAHKAVELNATKKSIDRAMRAVAEELKRKGEKVTLKTLNESALEVIRRAGGLTTKTKITVREHHEHESGS